MTYFGSCLCGAVKYQVNKFEKDMAHCHCSMCRKFHGAAFATFGEVSEHNFKWISGDDLLNSYKAPNGTVRKFCSHCGSSLVFESAASRNAKLIEIAIATLDESQGLEPDAHIFVESKVPWLSLNDSLPKYINHRNSQQTNFKEIP
ncbi:hypothetical protein P886_0316 [Alteromonadaceae bacterium 2753L.S.0a.02]|nr:hypothetical protein P886_0316 [Alteromonadaceae bacterium 2753L.S.0a.02]